MTELPVDPAVIALHYIQGRRHFIKTSSPPRLSSLLKYSSRFGILYWKDKSTRIAGNLTVAALEERTQLLTEKVIFIEGSPLEGLAPAIIPPPPPLFATKIEDQKPITIYLELNVSESENIGNIVGKLNFTKGSHFDGSPENALIVNSIGEIIVNKLIDFEMVEKFQIIFYERDLRRPSWFSKVEVSFNVIDVNDEAPLISGMPELLVIDETKVGQVVASLSVRDKDTANPFFLRWILSYPFELSEYFSISDSGELILEKYPENIFSGEIRVVASDNVKETISTVKVLVEKRKPSFIGRTGRSCEIAEYSASISEGAKIGAKITSLPRKFKILEASDGYTDYFRSSRGHLYLRKELDFEKIEKVALLVQMTNEKCQAILDISVEDLNDETPRFLRKFTFNATKEIGTVVGEVDAFDADKNDVLIYSTDSNLISISKDGKIELVELPISNEITTLLTASDGLHATTTDLTIYFKNSSLKMPMNLSSWADMNDAEIYSFQEGAKIFVDHELFYVAENILKYNEKYARFSGKFNLPIINLESGQKSTLQIVLCRKKEPMNFRISFSSTPVKLTLETCRNGSWLASLPDFLELKANELYLNIPTIFFQKSVGKQFSSDFVCLQSAELQPMTFDLTAGYFEKLEFEKERYIFHENRGKVKLFPSPYQYAFSSDDDVISVAQSGDLTLKSFRDGEKISAKVRASSLTYPVITASTTVTFISNSTRSKVIECNNSCTTNDDYIFKDEARLERNLDGSISVKQAFTNEKIIIEKGCSGCTCSIFAISKTSAGGLSDKKTIKKLVLTEDSKFIDLVDETVRLKDSSIKKSIEAFVFPVARNAHLSK
ncbi:unnamed protein product [Oikopleura dioica]|uniref:Cadherin domain-containing protein n=1 Tax=Oikopleura dioica TaxID=34765 RepID=E4YBI4_OIKDI|nr:unnamed protein product [Oikopleura dioica]